MFFSKFNQNIKKLSVCLDKFFIFYFIFEIKNSYNFFYKLQNSYLHRKNNDSKNWGIKF